jgi:DNA-binding transcriptional ArsR family regulator
MNDERPPTQLLMACLGDASRFRLVQVLMQGARCVSDLAVDIGLSQSCTTRHLQALERRGIVVGTREGKRVLYRLCFDRPEHGPLLAWALRMDPGTPAGHEPDTGSAPAAQPKVARPEAAAAPRRVDPVVPAAVAAPRPRRAQEIEDFLL